MIVMSELEDDEQPWGLTVGFVDKIDFCIWLLRSQRLQFPPFDSHPHPQNNHPHIEGMDEQSWLAWLKKVVAICDDRLYGHVPDINAEANHCWDRENEIRYLTWKEQEYQEAAATAAYLSPEATPAMLWDGEERVRQQIENLWDEYCLIPKDTNRLEDADALDRPRSLYDELYPRFSTRLSTLRIVFVSYPIPIFFPVAPVSILVSQASGLKSEDLRAGIFTAVESLARTV